MKLFSLFTLICVIAISSCCFAEEEATVSANAKEIEVSNLDFDTLPKESQVGSLAELVLVKDETNLTDLFLERIKKRHLILYPHAEGVAYVNGQLCHIGNYSQSTIYTVLEGPYYGTQTTVALNGVVLYVNYDYDVKYTPEGVILHHHYDDSKVITGSNQVIKFYN